MLKKLDLLSPKSMLNAQVKEEKEAYNFMYSAAYRCFWAFCLLYIRLRVYI